MTESPAAAPPDGAQAESARRRQTRERLMDAAFAVFAAHGIHAASVEQLCEAAGFSRGAFYSNFSSKEELFAAILERETLQWTGRMRERLDERLNGENPETLDFDRLGQIIVDVLGTDIAAREWMLVQGEATQLALREDSVARRQLESRQRTIANIVDLVVSALARMGRRFVIDEHQAVETLADIYTAQLTNALLERTPAAEIPDRLRAPLAAVLLGLTTRTD